MKKTIAIIGVFALALVLTGVADAAVVRRVSDTSIGTSAATWSIIALLRNNNTTGITNNVTSAGNSGANTIFSADDQSGTTVTTGVAEAASAVEGLSAPGNVANTNVLSETLESIDGADNTIEDIDDDSFGTTASADTVANDVVNNNLIGVTNTVDSVGRSGVNSVTSGDSLIDASVSTGASGAATLLSQDFNLNIKEVIRTIKMRTP